MLPYVRPKVGISSCLLGQPLRYNGGHKMDHFLHDTLGKYVKWLPVCPEVECGLGVPREPMRLIKKNTSIRLITTKTGIDLTRQMTQWSHTKLSRLENENLCGFVFKSRSPSSALRDCTIYNENGVIVSKGPGLFAQAFIKHFPLIPVEDESGLHDEKLRKNFIERIFVYARWQHIIRNTPNIAALMKFHTEHKLLFMSHGAALLRTLGSIIGRAKKSSIQHIIKRYSCCMMEGLKLESTIKKNVNVLYHAMGYFKRQLSTVEKAELIEIIEQYHNGYLPLTVPITILRHYVRKYANRYIARQVYLYPHPIELKPRNHALTSKKN